MRHAAGANSSARPASSTPSRTCRDDQPGRSPPWRSHQSARHAHRCSVGVSGPWDRHETGSAGPSRTTPDQAKRPLTGVSAGQGPLPCTGWQVKDSNLRSFRDGFTVRSHWPLGQPAVCAWKDSKQARMRIRPSAVPGRTSRWQTAPFDIVSKVDKQEVDNALNQAAKEVAQRYDFKGVGASIEWSGDNVLIKANTAERVRPSSMSSRPSSSAAVSREVHRLRRQGAQALGQGVPARGPAQGGHLTGERQEDLQDHPRRGPEDGQGHDPGRRAARGQQVPRRPAGGAGPAQGQGPRRRAAVHQLTADRRHRPVRCTAGACGQGYRAHTSAGTCVARAFSTGKDALARGTGPAAYGGRPRDPTSKEHP